MEKNQRSAVQEEIIFGSADSRVSTAISRDVKAGRLRRIAPKLYTTNLIDSPENIVRRNLYRIVARYFPGAVVSHRSALEGGLTRDGTLFLTFNDSHDILGTYPRLPRTARRWAMCRRQLRNSPRNLIAITSNKHWINSVMPMLFASRMRVGKNYLTTMTRGSNNSVLSAYPLSIW